MTEFDEHGHAKVTMTIHCSEAWPAGLPLGLLVECTRTYPAGQKGHTGKHINAKKDLQWRGRKLTPEERTRAEELRGDRAMAFGRAMRALEEVDDHDTSDEHFPHDYGSNGRCRIAGCRVYDPTEDDDRIRDTEDYG
jgi:hypothetical protein